MSLAWFWGAFGYYFTNNNINPNNHYITNQHGTVMMGLFNRHYWLDGYPNYGKK